MSNQDEWAVVVIERAYVGPEYADVGAFKVEKATAKTLMGRACCRDRHPIEECIRGLSEESAKDLAEGLAGQVAAAKALIHGEQHNLRSILRSARS